MNETNIQKIENKFLDLFVEKFRFDCDGWRFRYEPNSFRTILKRKDNKSMSTDDFLEILRKSLKEV